MHVLAMSRYGDVDRFINIAQRKAAQITDKPLPPLNLSAWRAKNNAESKWVIFDKHGTSTYPQNNVEMGIPVFQAFLKLLGR